MNINLFVLFLDIGPVGGGSGIFAGVVFFLVFLAVALIAFKLLKRTVKMAFRIAIVAIILVIAVAGSVSFWWLGSGRTPSGPRTLPSRSR